MQRITISLDDEEAQSLRREARRRHQSVSEVARTAIAGHLSGLGPDGRRVIPFAGLVNDGGPPAAAELEAYLEENWAREISRQRRR
jgi:hypothetical protein